MPRKPSPKTQLKKATDALEKALIEQYEAQNSIKRQGNEIVLPEYLEIQDAISALRQYQESMYEETTQVQVYQGHVDDILVCFYNVMKRRFSLFMGASEVIESFFGTMKINAREHTATIGYGETVVVPYGTVTVPGLPIEMEIGVNQDKSNPMQSEVGIQFEYERRFKPIIDEIIKETTLELETNSIFKGKAIDSAFNFINLDIDTTRVVYSESEKSALDAHLFLTIRKPDVVREMGHSVKRTILMSGPYGSGKSLTALVAAKEAIEHGWTFMRVLVGDDFKTAFDFAKKYQPCVVVFEDIDSVTQGERDTRINQILDAMDGILSKDANVITVFSTNHPERINEAMLRPGRIDVMLELGNVDAKAITDLVKAYSNGNLEDGIDIEAHGDELMAQAEGYTPAFIVEAIKRAGLHAAARDSDKISPTDIRDALKSLRPQYERMIGNKLDAQNRKTQSIDQTIAEAVLNSLKDELLVTMPEPVVGYLKKAARDNDK